MKKILLVLGMITCFATVTACGGKVEEPFQGTITAEQAEATAQNFATSLNEVIMTGAQAEFESDPVLSAAVASFEAALVDLGDYQSMDGCTFTEDEDGLTIIANITGSERSGVLELIFDEEYALVSVSANVTYSFAEMMTKAGLNTLMGMGTVFVVLILIACLIACFNLIPKLQSIFAKKEKKADVAVANAVAQIVENEAVQEEDDTELVAVIAAAIAASEGAASADGYVVRSIRKLR